MSALDYDEESLITAALSNGGAADNGHDNASTEPQVNDHATADEMTHDLLQENSLHPIANPVDDDDGFEVSNTSTDHQQDYVARRKEFPRVLGLQPSRYTDTYIVLFTYLTTNTPLALQSTNVKKKKNKVQSTKVIDLKKHVS
jgi:hypothetical protein